MGERGGTLGLLTIVAGAGAATLVVELAAVRVLAPWFGTSTTVWTNVIGVVLLALALGYALGSRLAARTHPGRGLGWALVVAAGLTAWLPALAHPVASAFLPQGVTLDRAAGLLHWGSLAATFVLFAPAALALGCVGPLGVECLQRLRGGHAGTAGGAVLCASTLGSLVGTFGTTHYLVPAAGLPSSFRLAAAVLLALGLVTLWAYRGRRAGQVATLLVVTGSFFGPGYAPQSPREGTRLLAARQSPYQAVRVVEFEGTPGGRRQLQVNEGFDSFQSVWQPEPGLLPPGHYYNDFALPPWWDGARGSWRVLVLGLGAGTAWRVLEGALPEGLTLEAEGLEIDPVVVELAREWMELGEDTPERRAHGGWDARAGLRYLEGEYDQIVLDTYANQMEIPAHLCTSEFFEELAGHLRPGGWLTINIGGFGHADPVVAAVTATAAAAFGGEALVARVPFSRNCIAHLRRGAELPRPDTEAWEIDPAAPVAQLLRALEVPGALQIMGGPSSSGAPLLRDDHNPIEHLQRSSIAAAAEALGALEATSP